MSHYETISSRLASVKKAVVVCQRSRAVRQRSFAMFGAVARGLASGTSRLARQRSSTASVASRLASQRITPPAHPFWGATRTLYNKALASTAGGTKRLASRDASLRSVANTKLEARTGNGRQRKFSMFGAVARGLASVISRLARQRSSTASVTSRLIASVKGGLTTLSRIASVGRGGVGFVGRVTLGVALALTFGVTLTAAPTPASAQNPTVSVSGPATIPTGGNATFTFTLSSPLSTTGLAGVSFAVETPHNSEVTFLAFGGSNFTGTANAMNEYTDSIWFPAGATTATMNVKLPASATSDVKVSLRPYAVMNIEGFPQIAYDLGTPNNVTATGVRIFTVTTNATGNRAAPGEEFTVTITRAVATSSAEDYHFSVRGGVTNVRYPLFSQTRTVQTIPNTNVLGRFPANSLTAELTMTAHSTDTSPIILEFATTGRTYTPARLIINESGPSGVGVRPVQLTGITNSFLAGLRLPNVAYEELDDYVEFDVYRNDTGLTAETNFTYRVTQTGSYLASNVTLNTPMNGTIASGEDSTKVRLYIDDDTTAEERGSVTLTLTDGTAGVASDATSYTYTIADDERPEVAVGRGAQIVQLDPGECRAAVGLRPDGTCDFLAYRRSQDATIAESADYHRFAMIVRPVDASVNATVRITRAGPLFANLTAAERITTHVIELNTTVGLNPVASSSRWHTGGFGAFLPGAYLADLNITIPNNMQFDGDANSITAEVIDTGDAYNVWADGNEVATEYSPNFSGKETLVIRDDDTAPEIDIARATTSGFGVRLGEFDIGDRNATFDSDIEISVTGTSSVAGSFRIQFANHVSSPPQNGTIGASCAAGVDYINPNATVQVPVGATSVSFDASPYICADGVVDIHGTKAVETFEIIIDEVRNLRMSTRGFDESGGVFTAKRPAGIIDLDPQISVVANVSSVVEGENFTVSFRTPKGVPIYHGLNVLPVVWAGNSSVNMTATTLADAITFTNGTEEVNMTIATNFVKGINSADPISVTIEYPTLADHIAASQYYWVNGSAATAVVQVVDSDLGVSLTPATQDVVEGSMAQLNLTVTGSSRTGDLDVTLVTEDVTAVAGTHYRAVNETLTFTASETAKSVNVTTLDNGLADGTTRELNVTAIAQLNATTNVTLRAVVRIVDSGLAVTFTPATQEVVEGETARLSISVPGTGRTEDVDVVVTTADVTAVAGEDYTAVNQTLTFAPSETSKDIAVVTLDNAVAGDGVRVLNVTAVAALDAATNVTLLAEVRISDNDMPPMISLRGPQSIGRGQNATYTLTTEGGVVSNESLAIMVEINGSVEAIYNSTTGPAIMPVAIEAPSDGGVQPAQVGGVRVAQTTMTSTVVNVTLPARTSSVPVVVTAANQPNAMISVRVLAGSGAGAGNYSVTPVMAAQMAVTQVRAAGFDAGRVTKAILPQVVGAMLDETGAAISGRVQDSFGDSTQVGVRGSRQGFDSGSGDGSAGGSAGAGSGKVGLRVNGVAVDDYVVETLTDAVRAEAEREAAEKPWDAPDAAGRRSLLELPDLGALAYTLDFNRGERGGVAVWTQVFGRSIEGEADGVAFDSTELQGVVSGVDARVSQNLLAGVGFSSVASEFDYSVAGAGATAEGTYEAELASVNPYVGYRTEGGANVWANVGVGEGEVTVKQAEVDADYEGEVEWQSWGVGFTSLWETVAEGAGRDVSLNWHGDVQMAMVEETATALTRRSGAFDGLGGSEIEVGRARFGAEVSQVVALDGGGVFTQSFDLAVRHDSGDLAEGGAVELAGAVGLDLPVGLRLDLSGRTLIFHEESVEDWGVRGGLAWVSQPGYGGRGLQLSVVPEWGNVAGRGDALLAGGVEAVAAGGLAGVEAGAGDGLAEVRYGFDVRYGIPLLRGGLLVPYVSGDAGDVGASAVYGGAYNVGRFAAGVEAAAGDDEGNAFVRYKREF